jgi:hypothetical protein
MTTVYRHTTTVGPGGVVEIRDPALPEGRTVQVTVLLEEPQDQSSGLLRFLGAAPGLYPTPEDADAFIRAERDAWER